MSAQFGQGIRFGALTLSWLARREFRRDRGVFRFGTATGSLLLGLAFGELHQWYETRIDALLAVTLAVHPVLAAHVRRQVEVRTLPAQIAARLHGQLEQQVVA